MYDAEAVDTTWQNVRQQWTSLVNDYGINAHSQIDERQNRKRMMDGEVVKDEARTSEERIRVDIDVADLDQT